MRNRTRSTAALAAVTLAAGAGLVALAGPANAAQSTLPVSCDNGQQLTVRVNTNHSSEHGGWGVGQIVAGGTGHLVPTVINVSLFDNAINQTLFTAEQAKGGGNANHNQSTVNCTASQTGVLGDFLNPGDTPPPGTSVSDPVTFTVVVTAVPHS
jgi:multisubunit Na+/H+ antiporter MnhC subunit